MEANLEDSLNEGRGLNPGDTPRGPRADSRDAAPLNEGRGLNPGDTLAVLGENGPEAVRSTKAGA